MNKKNKSEIILVVVAMILSLISLYFYKQSRRAIVTDEFDYYENSGITYKVYLNDNDYYKEEFLEEGMQYISSIIDNFAVDFNYNVKFEEDKKFEGTKKITADIKILDSEKNNKVIYEKNEILKEDKFKDEKNVDFVDQLKINYSKYNDITNNFKTKYGISADCRLIITYNIDYKSTDGEIKQNKTMNMIIPLSKQMINVEKSDSVSKKNKYVGKTTESPVNTVMLILFVLFLSLTGLVIVILLMEIKNRIKGESKYDRYVGKLLREYDSYITNSDAVKIDNNKNTVRVQSFKELLDVRNNLDKPIVYNKINENECVFFIVDNEVYRFDINRKEME